MLAQVSTPACSKKRSSSAVSLRFPGKLYRMLEENLSVPNQNVNWTADGKAIKILKDPNTLLLEINSHFPNIKEFSSFKKQLQNYGFKESKEGYWSHVSFSRGNEFEAQQMRVVKKTTPAPPQIKMPEELFLCESDLDVNTYLNSLLDDEGEFDTSCEDFTPINSQSTDSGSNLSPCIRGLELCGIRSASMDNSSRVAAHPSLLPEGVPRQLTFSQDGNKEE